jgi:hypothetical protein
VSDDVAVLMAGVDDVAAALERVGNPVRARLVREMAAGFTALCSKVDRLRDENARLRAAAMANAKALAEAADALARSIPPEHTASAAGISDGPATGEEGQR